MRFLGKKRKLNKHYHSGINFLTPNSKHSGKDEAIMAHRRNVYNTARE